jgi:dTDP-4-dehydrorhamnose reductase
MNRVLLVVGGAGMLGRDVCEALGEDYEVLAPDEDNLDFTDVSQVRRFFRRHKPDLVVNAAAFTDVDGCDKEPDKAYLSNAVGARNLAVASERYGAELVHISTDYVFDGTRETPYFEYDATAPHGEYGRSKWAGEELVRTLCRRHYIMRISVLFGLHRKNFVDAVASRAMRGEDLKVPAGRVGCPTHTWDVAQAIQILDGTECYGTYHFNQGEALTRAEFARRILKAFELGGVKIHEVEPEELGEVAPRPHHVDMAMRQWRLEGFPEPRGVDEALAHLRARKEGDHVTQGKDIWKGGAKAHERAMTRKRPGAWVPQREYEAALEEDGGRFVPRSAGDDRGPTREALERRGERDRDERPYRRDRDDDRGRRGPPRGGRGGKGGYRGDRDRDRDRDRDGGGGYRGGKGGGYRGDRDRDRDGGGGGGGYRGGKGGGYRGDRDGGGGGGGGGYRGGKGGPRRDGPSKGGYRKGPGKGGPRKGPPGKGGPRGPRKGPPKS